MAETTGQDNIPTVGGRVVELRVDAKLENLAVVRTLVASVGTFEDLDFDAVADLRLAVDEACTRLVRSAVPGSVLRIVIDPTDDAVLIHALTTCEGDDGAIVAPGSFSWHVLSSLTDEVQTFTDGLADGARVHGISLTARRVSQLQ